MRAIRNSLLSTTGATSRPIDKEESASILLTQAGIPCDALQMWYMEQFRATIEVRLASDTTFHNRGGDLCVGDYHLPPASVPINRVGLLAAAANPEKRSSACLRDDPPEWPPGIIARTCSTCSCPSHPT